MDLLRHLRYFTVVAEELHFGRAAELLGMAQPPLSQRIRGLEAELGVTLFDRSRRRVRLTEAGTVLLGESRELLARVERVRERVSRADRGEYGTLRVGVPPEIPGSVLGAVLTEFTAVAPQLRLDLRELTGAEQVELLVEGRLDAGLVHHPVDLVHGLGSGEVIELPLGVVLPRTSPLADEVEVRLEDLAGQALVTYPRDAAPGLYDGTLAACRDGGFHPAGLSTALSAEVMLGLVIAGYGVAFSHPAIARKEPRVVWRALAPRAPAWRLAFAWPAHAVHPGVPSLVRTATRVLRADGADTLPDALPRAHEDAAGHGGAGEPVVRPWNVVYGTS